MPATYSNLTGLGNTEENPGGIGSLCYWAALREFATIQQPDNLSTATTTAGLATVSTAHVFATGGCFKTAYITQGKGDMEMDVAAEVDASGGFIKLKTFLPGYNAENFGNLRMQKNDDFIFLVPMADGKVSQLGSQTFPVKVESWKFMTAQNGSGVRGVEITYKAFQMSPVLYTSTIQTTPQP